MKGVLKGIMGVLKKSKRKIIEKIYPPFKTAKSVARGKGDFLLILFDVIYCRCYLHINYDEYLKYRLYNFKNRYRKNFVTCYHQRHDYCKINSKNFTRSKYRFYQRAPELFQREMILIPSCGQETFLSFARKHKEFIIKPDRGSLGRGVQVFRYINDEQAREFFNTAGNDELVCEEYIRQHPALNALNPSCVNTIRVVSLLVDDDVEILSAVLKFGGTANTIVDNMHQGGIGAQIDVVSGITVTCGYDYMFNKFTHHPVTNAQIIGMQIPNWEKVVAFVKIAHKKLYQCRLFGWDIAITADGLDLVEANNAPGPLLMQTMDCIPKGEKLIKVFKQGNPYKEDNL